MDNQTQVFLELSAMNDLVQLVADKRAAWLWAADGARVLWANAAGAAFFSAPTVSDLAGLTALERSPARPHIARIAEAGMTDRFSIDRLRFYRGLRVMLLTCQCKRVELADGGSAALIVCGDKGLALTKEPIPAFANLFRASASTVFLVSDGQVEDTIGTLEGTPEQLDMPQGQKVLFGAVELNGNYHEGGMLQIPAGPRIIVLNDTPVNDEEADEETTPEPSQDAGEDSFVATVAPGLAAAAAAMAAGEAPQSDPDEEGSQEGTEPENAALVGQDEADETFAEDISAEEPSDSGESDLDEEVEVDEAGESDLDVAADAKDADEGHSELENAPVAASEELEESPGESVGEQAEDREPSADVEDDGFDEDPADLDATSGPDVPMEDADEDDAPTDSLAHDPEAIEAEEADAALPPVDDEPKDESFIFQPRRRPVRFAWKMDVDQRFTFISDEFAEVLGPDATNIVGQTWEDVSEKFGLDPRGNIGRALDRRDTWSGKTVGWPVTGAALRVPVDMAALPAFDRNRTFEGYRGFGVCRTSDAVQDPDGFVPTPLSTVVGIVAEDGFSTDADLPDDEVDEKDTGSEDTATDDIGAQAEDGSFEDEADLEEEEVTEVADEILDQVDGSPAEIGDTDPGMGEEETSSEEQLLEPEPELDDTNASPEETRETAAAESTDPDKGEDTADLKPEPANALGGKTFLGASAAALVGSLAMFKGKSGSKPAETPSSETPITETEGTDTNDVNLAEDLKSAAAALDAKLGGEDTTEDTEASDELEALAEEEAENSLDAETVDADTVDVDTADADTADLDAGEPARVEEEDVGPEEEALATDDTSPDNREAEPVEDDAPDETVFDVEEDEALDDAMATSSDEPETAIPGEIDSEEASADDHDAEATDQSADIVPEEALPDVPTGVAGPAELKPAEIENAVKTLAQSYKPVEPRSPDLFDEEPEAAATSDHPEADTAMSDTQADHVADSQAEEASGPLEEGTEPDLTVAANENGDLADGEGDEETLSEEDDRTDDEEREFFEETGAFEQEERAVEAETAGNASKPEPEPEPEVRTGQVIPLATARPRVVPVDTSGLSRPERQAFRKIAEALGARLEGDLEDFEAPDPEEEKHEDDLPAEVPEAGPIDPSLLDRLPIGIAIVHDREVLYANKALLKMLGYSSIARLSEAGGLEALFIDDTDELADAVGVDGEVDEAMKMRLADGGVLTVDAHMHSVPWNGSRGLMISITERQAKPAQTDAPSSPNFFAEVRAELDNARDQISEMDTILETATDGVLVLDQHGTIVKVNGSAEALFSANRSDMIGAPFTEFLAPESHRSASDYLDGLSRNGVASILNDGREVLGQVPAGGLIPLFMTMGRITDRDDEAKFCAVLRDITQWKTAEEELTQAKRQAENASSQKSDFLAKISHEIRTPLNAIIGFSEVMMEERFGPIGNDRYKDYLKDIRTSGSHIMSLINDLLDLSKIEAGKLDLKFTAVSTNDVINECVALMQPQANRERVIIRASLPESVPDVVADPRSLRQIVLNLLSNGIKYNKSGGQVILSTALESNGEVALRVRDTGTGMSAKQLAAALEPFRQLHTSSRGGGTGLGLPLTKALVEANRASFHIDSTPDQGTLVEIVFPTQRVLSE